MAVNFNQQAELSSDLEWMLQSGQVSLPILADALLAEYGDALYRLCLSIMDDERVALFLVSATISSALLDAHLFRPEARAQIRIYSDSNQHASTLIKAWLFLLALDHIRDAHIFKKIPAPPEYWLDFNRRAQIRRGELAERANNPQNFTRPQIRLIACLYYLHGCSLADIAALLQTSETSLKADLESFRQNILQEENAKEFEIFCSQIDEDLFKLGQQACSQIYLSETDLQTVLESAIKFAENKSRQKRVTSSILKAAMITLSAIIFGGVIWGIRQVPPTTVPTPEVVYQTVIVTRVLPAQSIAEKIVVPTQGVVPTATLNREEAIYIVKLGDTLHSIARQYGSLSAQTLFELNRLAPDSILEPGQVLLLPLSLPQVPWPTATPVDQASAALIETLEGPPRSADSPKIYHQYRWFASGWQTLWADILFSDFTSSDREAGQNITRLQTWLSGSQLLALSGPYGNPPQEVLLALLDENRFFRALPKNGLGWFEEISAEEAYSSDLVDVFLTYLLNPFYPGARPGNRFFVMVGNDTLDGHAVEIVEEYQKSGELTGRMKIDQQGGLILERQKYPQENPGSLAFEMTVKAWQYNIDFPQALFDPRLPWRGGYAQNSTGQPEALAIPPPH